MLCFVPLMSSALLSQEAKVKCVISLELLLSQVKTPFHHDSLTFSFFIWMSHEVFLREKLIHTKLHIKLKKLEFYFNFSLLPSSKMVANENLQVDIPSRISPSESAEQSPGNPTLTGCWRCRFDLWVRKIPWRRKWQPTPVFLPEKSHGQRSLAVYSPWGRKESDTNEHTHRTQKGDVFTPALATVS